MKPLLFPPLRPEQPEVDSSLAAGSGMASGASLTSGTASIRPLGMMLPAPGSTTQATTTTTDTQELGPSPCLSNPAIFIPSSFRRQQRREPALVRH